MSRGKDRAGEREWWTSLRPDPEQGPAPEKEQLTRSGRWRLEQWSLRMVSSGRRRKRRRCGDRIRYWLSTWGAFFAYVLTIAQLLGIDLHGWILSMFG